MVVVVVVVYILITSHIKVMSRIQRPLRHASVLSMMMAGKTYVKNLKSTKPTFASPTTDISERLEAVSFLTLLAQYAAATGHV